MQYSDFDLWIDSGDGAVGGTSYQTWAASATSGETPRQQSSIDFSAAAFQADLHSLEEGKTDRALLIRLGSGLFQSVFRGDIDRLYQWSFDAANESPDQGIRVRLRLAPPEISNLPWELLYSPKYSRFLTTDPASPVVRHVEMMAPVPHLEALRPLRMLVAIPNVYAPLPALSAEKEKSVIEAALVGFRKWAEVRYLEGDVTLEAIAAALEGETFHCFHFVGHGGFSDGRGHLLLNGEPGTNKAIGDRRFSRLFAPHPSMKLVVLNACHGAASSSVKPLVGTAAELVKTGMPAVVAMQFGLLDDAGVVFAREFYQSLFHGPNKGRVDVAVTKARAALAREMPGEREMVTPVLYMRAPHGMLFDPVTGRRFRDLVWSRDSVQTERVVDSAHERNVELLLEAQADRPGDGAIASELERERAEHAALRARIALRNRLGVSAVVIVMLMSCLSVVRLFDIFGLDTKVETWTMMLGGLRADSSIHEDLALVVLDKDDRNDAGETYGQSLAPKDESLLRKKLASWRPEHAKVLHKLILARAKVVMLGYRFDKLDPDSRFDRELIEAVRAIDAAGPRLVLPFAAAEDGVPVIDPALRTSTVGAGIACAGERLGVATVEPLLVEKRDGGKIRHFPSVVLAAYAAYHDALPGDAPGRRFEIEEGDLRIRVRTTGDAPPHPRFSVPVDARATSEECPTIEQGDRVAELMVLPLSLPPPRSEPPIWPGSVSYAQLLAMDDKVLRDHFQNRIVFVGHATGEAPFESSTLFGSNRWGIHVLADAMNTLLKGVHIRSLPWQGQLLVMIVLGLTGAFLRYWIPDSRRHLRRGLLIGLTIAYLSATVFVFAYSFLLLNTLYHLGALWLAYWAAHRVQRQWFT